MCVFMYLGHLRELKLFGTKKCISTTFGHISEKRTRCQPWFLDIKDCINSTFGSRCYWKPWRIEERKENEEITFPAIFPANHHHKRRHHRRTTIGPPPQVEKTTLTSCTHGYDRSLIHSSSHLSTHSLTSLHYLSFDYFLILHLHNLLVAL